MTSPDQDVDVVARVDAEIIRQVAKRSELVRRLRLDAGDAPDASSRAAAISAAAVERALSGSSGTPPETDAAATATGSNDPLSSPAPADIRAVLRHIASVTEKTAGGARVVCLGPYFSFTHLAAMKYFGAGVALDPVATIEAVFDAVVRAGASRRDDAPDSGTGRRPAPGTGDAAGCRGIVPIENSTDGRVVDTLGMFLRTRVGICGEVLLPIHHCLLAKDPAAEIREIHSKPQALSQCRGWIAQNMPGVAVVENASTAAAAKLAADRPGVAAIAAAEAGFQYGLTVIEANIEDQRNNVTRFAILGNHEPPPSGDDKTSLLFQLKHQPGALADAMQIFKAHDLNLTWIESFPEPGQPREYRFFVELGGHRSDPPVAQAIERLGDCVNRLEVLGSYPRATL